VNLARLSIWLVSLSKDAPFTFVDHAIKCGDSLVGLTNQQIAAFHWDPTQARDRVFGQEKLEQQIAKVAAARKSILDWTEDTEAAVLKKLDFLAAADSAAASLKTTGDLAIAAFFAGDKPKQRQQNRDEYLHRHIELQKGDPQQIPWEVNALKELGGGAYPIRPFHWEIEFPEVFSRENPGFDAIVGNPPFLGGTRISTRLSKRLLEYIVLSTPQSGDRADLVAYFVRRAYAICRNRGSIGLVTTNTIAQGDTRLASLAWICANGGSIYNAIRSEPWPGEAAVIVSVIHLGKGFSCTPVFLNRIQREKITSFLFHSGPDSNPQPLKANSGIIHPGVYPYGSGFQFDDSDACATSTAEMRLLIKEDPRNEELIFPYIGGDEILSDPAQKHRRFVINFGDRSLEDAAQWPTLLRLLEKKVKPERLSLRGPVSEWPWWKFWRIRADLMNGLQAQDRYLCHSFTSKYIAFSFLPSGTLLASPHLAFLIDRYIGFAVLQSSLHEIWARFFGSTMGNTLRYTSGDCFETFPFPLGRENNSALDSAGRDYYEYRSALMVRNDEGLTKTYNRFHDPEECSPDIHQLRTLHAATDRAVLAAYGWPDVPTTCEFLLDYEEDEDSDIDSSPTAKRKGKPKKKPYRYRWPDAVRDDVLARLLALNAELYAEEVALGLHSKGAKQASKVGGGAAEGKRRGRPPKAAQPGETEPMQAEQMGFGL